MSAAKCRCKQESSTAQHRQVQHSYSFSTIITFMCTQDQCKTLTAPLRELQVSVESMQRDNLLASSCQWNEQLSQQAAATQEFAKTSSRQLDHIGSSVKLLLNEQLLEDKPTGAYHLSPILIHTYTLVKFSLHCLFNVTDYLTLRFQCIWNFKRQFIQTLLHLLFLCRKDTDET